MSGNSGASNDANARSSHSAVNDSRDVHTAHQHVYNSKQQQQQVEPLKPDTDVWRRWLGKHVRETGSSIDANLTLFRIGCLLATAGSLVAAVRFSGAAQRFSRVEDIPPWYFSHHKKLRVRMVRQCEDDPSVFFVYHTPFLRRVLLHDTLPPSQQLYNSSSGANKNLLAVRPFGVQVDESAHEWVWSNFVSSHRYMTIHLLHRLNGPGLGDGGAVATCHMSLRRPPFQRDFALEIVGNGLGECLPESLDKYDDGSGETIAPLIKRLQQLDASQKHAQVMQYGIWKDWQDEALSSRVLSAGKRATARGFQKLVNKIAPH